MDRRPRTTCSGGTDAPVPATRGRLHASALRLLKPQDFAALGSRLARASSWGEASECFLTGLGWIGCSSRVSGPEREKNHERAKEAMAGRDAVAAQERPWQR